MRDKKRTPHLLPAPPRSVAQPKDQATELQSAAQREVIPLLSFLQTSRDDKFQWELVAKIDATNPTHGVELNDLQKRYSEYAVPWLVGSLLAYFRSVNSKLPRAWFAKWRSESANVPPVRLRPLFPVSAQISEINNALPTGRLTKLCRICDKVLLWSRHGFSTRLWFPSAGIGRHPRRPTAPASPAESVGPMLRHFLALGFSSCRLRHGPRARAPGRMQLALRGGLL